MAAARPWRRLSGVLAAGGGILSTVAATRAATDEELLAGGRARLAQMLANGTTTAEAKSGYGLDVAGELRLLALTGRLAAEGPIELVPTFLGAHAVPAEFRDRADGAAAGTAAYVEHVIAEQLPAVARQGIARFCDVFCENGVFTRRAVRPHPCGAAAGLGLALRLHADELAPSGGAELAAELAGEPGCASADHLAAPSEDGIAALARPPPRRIPVVATLLPATSWFLGKHHFAPARRFIDAGIPVALATDLNPGTSPTLSLPLVDVDRLRGDGHDPGRGARRGHDQRRPFARPGGPEIGSIEPGKQADLVVWDVGRSSRSPTGWAAAWPERSSSAAASSSSAADRLPPPRSGARLRLDLAALLQHDRRDFRGQR